MQRQLTTSVRVAGALTITKMRGGTPVWRSEPLPNKVVSSSGYGRNLLARALAGDGTYPLTITAAALGTGSTAAADADTDLETPTASDLPITNLTATDNVLNVDVFVPDGDLPTDTYSEFGLYCGGQLFARIIVSPGYSKADGEDTLFSYTLTITG